MSATSSAPSPASGATRPVSGTFLAPASVMLRIRGPDPQRRKVGHTSFYGRSPSGQSILTASGTLCLFTSVMEEQTPHVYVVASGEIIAPFLKTNSNGIKPSLLSASSVNENDTSLVDGTLIDILVESRPGSESVWWNCSLQAFTELADVDSSVSVLTQNSPDWELGWSKPIYPPPLMPHATSDGPSVQTFNGGRNNTSSVLYPNGRKRSAGLIAILKVLRPTSEVEAELQSKRTRGRSSTPPSSNTAPITSPSWPSNYPRITPTNFPPFHIHPWLPDSSQVSRGTSVTVFSSPYGLLSPHIFHNTMTRGIVSNCVILSDRERDFRPGDMVYGSNARPSTASLAGLPSSLFLLDTRCFSGSEGAPVCLTNLASSPTLPSTSSPPPPLLALVTLPIRHSSRGSAVELNLAIPMNQIETFLRSKNLLVWTPASIETKPNPPPQQQQGRGEGWRIIQNARQTTGVTTAPTSSTRSSLAHLLTAAPTRSRSPGRNPTDPSSKSNSPRSSNSAFSLSPLSSINTAFPSTAPSILLPKTATIRAVERAERSVVVARIGGSWASAIVLTKDGYLLTNAHLLRPFLESTSHFANPDSASTGFTPSTVDPDNVTIRPPLLFDEAIKLQSHVHLTVRIEAMHLQIDANADNNVENPSNDNNGKPTTPPSMPQASVGWLNAKLVYISQGPWDAAIIKISCTHPLYPIAFHPAFRNSQMDSTLALSTTASRVLPMVGSGALAIGHALFAPASALLPTVTAGVLSKIVHLPHPHASAPPFPALLVSSAAVHNGNSGGLLIDEESGYFLGMVTSNVMHTPISPNVFPSVHVRTGADSSASEEKQAELQAKFDEFSKQESDSLQAQILPMIIPHLNFSIPYTALLPLLDFCEGGAQDISFLRDLESTPAIVQRLWQLTELNPEPPPQPSFSPKYRQLIQQIEQEEERKSAL